ncbi:MAG: hypothetical protein ACM3SV_06585 [Betaproteobacteria bacterium]
MRPIARNDKVFLHCTILAAHEFSRFSFPASFPAYTESAPFGANRSGIMGKVVKSNKEAKKPSAKTPKEKKAAKQAKKHESEAAPLLTPRPH